MADSSDKRDSDSAGFATASARTALDATVVAPAAVGKVPTTVKQGSAARRKIYFAGSIRGQQLVVFVLSHQGYFFFAVCLPPRVFCIACGMFIMISCLREPA